MKNWGFRLFVFALLYLIDYAFNDFIVGVVEIPLNYLAAIVFGGLTVGILFALLISSKLIRAIMILQVCWVVVHLIGLILWLWRFPPDFYNQTQLVLNITQIAILIWMPSDDQHNFTDNFRRIGYGLRRYRLLRNNHTRKN